MTITDIALSKLEPSPINVRKTGGTSIDDLAASIEAHGLIQTLTVRPGLKDKFEVVAGGRRLAALNRLAKEKRSANGEAVTKAFPVPCRVLTDEDATEISLAENAIRQAMHPADQFDAFKALADGGMSTGDVAARFGMTEKVVRQRLKLAALSPVLLAAFRKDEMSIEQAMAFTVTNTHDRQEEVWQIAKKEKGYYSSQPTGIRSALTGQSVRASSSLAKAIGEGAYLAAGGTIERDLFSTDDEAYWTDRDLIERLMQEMLAHTVAKVKAEGWGEVLTCSGYFNSYAEGCRRVQEEGRELTANESARRDALNMEIEALGNDRSDETRARHQALESQIDAIDEVAANDWSGVEGKPQMLAVVKFNAHSGIEVERGYVRNAENAQGEVFTGHGTAAPSKPKEKAEFSATLLADLSAQRTMAMRAEMATNPAVALDALTWTLALREFFHGSIDQHSVKISLTTHFPGRRDLAESKAAVCVGERRSFWVLRLPDKAAGLWEWVRNADRATILDLLAYLVATSLDATQINGAPASENSNVIHAALGLDMVNYFGPFMSDCLARINRTQVLEAVEEAVSPEAARALNGAKKAELVAGAEKALAGTRWLPKPLRLPEAKVLPVLEDAA